MNALHRAQTPFIEGGVTLFEHEDSMDASQTMRRIAEETPTEGLLIQELLDRLGNDGLLIAIVILSFPFLLPVSIPGVSTPFGAVIILVCVSVMRRSPVRLPTRLQRVRMKQAHIRTIAKFAANVLSKLEKWSKPRYRLLTARRSWFHLHMLNIILSALCLLLPLPLPLSNFLPAYAMVFTALGVMRRDGYFLLVGYTLMVLSLAYITVFCVLSLLGMQYVLSDWLNFF